MRSLTKKSTQRGAVIVEFAVLLPFILFLLMGTTEFGLLFYNQQVLTNASREGARAGTAYLSDATVRAIVKNYCNNRLISFVSPPPDPAVTFLIDGDGTLSYPNNRKVNVAYNYTFLIPNLLGLGTSIQLKASTEMRMENTDLTPP